MAVSTEEIKLLHGRLNDLICRLTATRIISPRNQTCLPVNKNL